MSSNSLSGFGFGASLDWQMKFWDLVEQFEKVEGDNIVAIPSGLSWDTVSSAKRIADARKIPKPNYQAQADGIYQ